MSDIARFIDKIILHCSDSDNPDHDNIEMVRKWHLERGWSDIGYHFFINKAGVYYKGRDLSEVGAHCEGFNKASIGICLSGKLNFTDAQFKTLATLLEVLLRRYKLSKTKIFPHNHFNKNKTCPNYDFKTFLNYYLSHVS